MAVEELGGYRLVEKLGSGGMGVVYLGMDANNNPVAVKVLHPSIASDETARMRLAREVRTLRRIHHPRIAAVLDAELDAEKPFIVTEFVDGLTLSDDVKQNGPFAEDELVHFGHALLDALTAVHNAGVIHRDLKPANVMIMDGEPMVIDFGIAQAADEVKVTVTGLVMGTPGYLSPEIVDGGQSDEKTDWWGWAATMAFAATGHNPFGSGSIEAVIARVASGRANLDGAPARFVPLLRACLDPKPDRRPTGPMILDALVEIESGAMPSLGRATPVPPVPVPPPHLGDTMVAPPVGGQFGEQYGQQFGEQLGHHSQDRYSPVGLLGSPRPATPTTELPPHVIQPPPQTVPGYGTPGFGSGPGQGGMPPGGQPGQGYDHGFGSGPGQAGMPLGGQTEIPPEQVGYGPMPAGGPEPLLPPLPGARRLAALSVLALSTFAIAVTPLGPFFVLVAVVGWQILARTAGTLVWGQRKRLVETGVATTSGMVARAPIALVTSTLMTGVNLLLPLIAALAVAVLMRIDVAQIVPRGYSEAVSLWSAAGAGALVMWFGPGSLNLRRGSRHVMAVVAGKKAFGHTIVTIGFFLLAFLAYLTILGGAATVWWPLETNPFEMVPQSN